MKIAFVTEYVAPKDKPYFGGVDSRTINMAKHLAKDNDVHIVTTFLEGTEREEDYDGIKIHRISTPRKFTQRGDFMQRIKFNSDVISEISRIKPDLVDASGFVSYDSGYKSAKNINVPSIVTVHEIWQGEWVQNMGLVNGFIGHFLERKYLRHNFDGYISVSNFTKDKLMRKMGICEEKIEVVHNGVDLELYKSVEIDKKYENPTIVTICRLVSYKMVDDIIKAVNILKREFPDIRLKIIGAGPKKEYLARLSKKLGLEKNIEFLGKIRETREMVKILKKSHVFVLSSIVEGFGMVVVEAMAAGVPYVVSDITPLREATGRVGGLFFEPRNYNDLANKIKVILHDDILRRDLMKDVEKHISQYEWSTVTAKAMRFYEKFCGELIETNDNNRNLCQAISV